MADKTETEAGMAAFAAANAMTGDSLPFRVVPDGYCIADVSRYRERPLRTDLHMSFAEASSLSEYLDKWLNEDTTISADFDAGTITAVIDGDGIEAPSHRTHVATYDAQVDERLKAWLAIDGKPMSQTSFGTFLEDRAADVAAPDPATIMEMVMQFEATKKVQFKQSTRLSDGQRQFLYVEENEARGAITLPDRFIVRVPIFRGQPAQDVLFRLQYRITDGSLSFTAIMHDKKIVMREAFALIVEDVRDGLPDGFPIYVTG